MRNSEIAEIIETRGDFARRVLWAVQDGKTPPPFSIYLRSFVSDGHLESERYGATFGPTTVFGSRHAHLEEVFANALSSDCPLIGLGEDQEFPAGGRLSIRDEYWKETVGLLARAATLIVLMPSDHEGTLWETRFLRDEALLHKTIFVMPPKPTGNFPVSDEWVIARTKYGDLGLTLPPYDKSGCLIRIDPGAPSAAAPLVVDSTHLRQHILALGTAPFPRNLAASG